MNRDTSRDTSQGERCDRRLWLQDRCPRCAAQPGARCRSRSLFPPQAASAADAARCPRLAAAAVPGVRGPAGRAVPDPARAASGRAAHRASCPRARRVARAGGRVARARASGRGAGAGALLGRRQGAKGRSRRSPSGRGKRELAHWWGAGDSELAGAVAAPVWGRYGSFRGQPRTPVRRPATAASGAGRPPRALGCASSQAAQLPHARTQHSGGGATAAPAPGEQLRLP
jgi:hypothetical protein